MFQRHIAHNTGTPSVTELSEARFRRFLKDVEAYERQMLFEHTLDSFLDLYSQWRKSHDTSLKLRLVMLVFELHRLNHEFECDLSFRDAAVCARSR